MEFHDAANIFPLDEEAIAKMAEDIRQHGQLVPIEVMDGKILDGRQRFKACALAGVKPAFREVRVNDPVSYVLSLNLSRRHLSEAQRAMVGAKARAWYDQQAKERQREHGGTAPGKKKTLPVNLPEVNKGDARDAVGKAVGVSGKSIDHATRVLKQGVPELVKAVEEDRMAVSTAAKATQLPPERQVDQAAKAKGRPSIRKSEHDTYDASASDNEEPQQPKLQGIGVFKAQEAIAILKSIPVTDPLRKRGFQIVTDWITHCQRVECRNHSKSK